MIARQCAKVAAAVVVLMVFSSQIAESANRSPRIRRFTSADGLSQDSVNAIIEDHTGFIWIATTNGLNRFDGYRFDVFKFEPGEPETVSPNLSDSLFRTAPGRC
jgi:ligand-binding sensor domain-containing protein